MELSKNYIPAPIEEKWHRHWLEKKYFNSVPDHREPFTIVIPPPNVTGVLHMGHTLNETVQDVLVRKARMSGFNACWVPGSDHASIATEARVVNMLKERGIEKKDLTREEFLKYAFEWKEKYGGIIYNQIDRLGCSVDWNRVTYTMDDHYYQAVISVFVTLFNKGLIYRGARMINWDPSAKTALSDEEVEYRDLQGKLYYLKYFLEEPAAGGDGGTETGDAKTAIGRSGNNVNPVGMSQPDTYTIENPGGSIPLPVLPAPGYIVIATQRPETIMGDTAICVNPSDERYAHLKGAYAFVPLINRRIPIIFDEYVSTEFGTGALKVTPAHDINDYNLGLRHHLEVVDTLNDDGTLSKAAQIYVGEDRFVARKKIIEELKEKKFLIREEEYQTRVGHSQRTGVVVEPRISTQWFLKMKDLAGPALKAVLEEDIHIHPAEKFIATYRYWMENVKDWCISRQLWWGQQIPAWYDSTGRMVVALNKDEAANKYFEQYQVHEPDLKQDEDVLDTWFSSWLFPIESFGGITNPGNADMRYYYPTSVLVTGQDIIFFWVARMIMAGFEFEKQIPFKHVYFTGMVRDKLGRKMSKSLGNSPDLLQLIDKYGADAVRFGILISSPAGNDLLFDENSLEQGRNFNNKLWNALKLVKMWSMRTDTPAAEEDHFATAWFQNRLLEARAQVDGLIKQFRLSEALKVLYSLIWDDFCSWYLEWIKPGFERPIALEVFNQTIAFFTDLMQMLHPYMPFITEEIYHVLEDRQDDLCVKQFNAVKEGQETILAQAALLKEVITTIRDMRFKNQIKPKEEIELYIQTSSENTYRDFEKILAKQVNAKTIVFTGEQVENTVSMVVGKDKLFISAERSIDTAGQKEDLAKELDYLKGFIVSVDKKLGNERFVQNAKPEVVELERKKKADAQTKLKVIEESLGNL